MLYGMDLLWMNVRPKYKTFSVKQPSSIFSAKLLRQDHRTAEQIKHDILRKLTEGGKR